MNEPVIKKAIYDCIRSILDEDALLIWADQNQHRPMRPYVSMKLLLGPVAIGQDEERQDEDDFVMISGFRELTLSVNYFGENPFRGLGEVQTRLRFPSTRETLYASGLVFVSDSGLRDLSQLLETQTEQRAQMDLVFRYSENASDADMHGPIIERVELENGIDGYETVVGLPEPEPEPEP